MKLTLFMLIGLAASSIATLAQQAVTPPTPKTAAAAVAAAIESVGGEARLKSVESTKVESIGHE